VFNQVGGFAFDAACSGVTALVVYLGGVKTRFLKWESISA